VSCRDLRQQRTVDKQQVRHLPGSRVQEIGRETTIERPDLSTVGAHGLGESWAAFRVDDDHRLLSSRVLDEQLQECGFA